MTERDMYLQKKGTQPYQPARFKVSAWGSVDSRLSLLDRKAVCLTHQMAVSICWKNKEFSIRFSTVSGTR